VVDGAINEGNGGKYSKRIVEQPKVTHRCVVELYRGAGLFGKDAVGVTGPIRLCLYYIVRIPLTWQRQVIDVGQSADTNCLEPSYMRKSQ
jgi:hypothetical protein